MQQAVLFVVAHAAQQAHGAGIILGPLEGGGLIGLVKTLAARFLHGAAAIGLAGTAHAAAHAGHDLHQVVHGAAFLNVLEELLGVDLPDDVVKKVVEGVKAKIKAGNLTPVVPEGDPAIMGKPTLHSVIDKQLDAAKCVGCGLCINNCPVGAIGNDLAINLEACIECQRCSHICPVAARTYYTNWDGTDGKYLAPRKPVTYML